MDYVEAQQKASQGKSKEEKLDLFTFFEVLTGVGYTAQQNDHLLILVFFFFNLCV